MDTNQQHSSRTSALALAALGVVYGDIGTSPLYTVKEIFSGPHHPVPITPDNILGILSVIFWTLTIVVAVKYAWVMLRADNKGEGGIMALIALVQSILEGHAMGRRMLLLGLFGAALFYGDSVITPAISVLSAVEGLEVATPAFDPYIIPITLGVLAGLFFVQRRGTAEVGGLFGKVTLLWFAVLAVLGVVNIAQRPQVLAALNPLHALAFLSGDPRLGYFSLGSVVLAVTGAEALYADMGHFGRRAVRIAWYGLVLPALVLNYFGQGALLLANPAAIANPFYLMAPGWALYPMVAIATVATVIASQAVISGTYSITQQAIQLGYAPRMEIQHTSSKERGQIYLPGVNWTLFAAVAVLVVGFGSSSRLAAAYGIAVTGTMVITTLLAFIVARAQWQWKPTKYGLILGGFLIVDLAYFSANLVKIHDGGWFPLTLGALVFLLMTTWKRGRKLLHTRLASEALPLDDFVAGVTNGGVTTIPGTAVFMTPNPAIVPHALLHSMKHYKCLHERIIILTVASLEIPHVPLGERATVQELNSQFILVRIRFGFMDEPNLPEALERCGELGLVFDMMDTSFFLGRETLIPKLGSELAFWREKLFIAMFRNAGSAAAYFKLPPNRVVELGTQIVL
jgi:KUP system potassium uptake protein